MPLKNPGTTPLRGEIWWAALDPTVGSEVAETRPCLVLSTDLVNRRRRTVVVVPLSSSPPPRPPLRVAVDSGGRTAVALIDQVRAIAKERLRSAVGHVSEAEMEEVEKALRRILEL